MKFKIFAPLFLISMMLGTQLNAQSVLDPNDPVITYNSSNPPTQPPWGQVGKWVRTVVNNWSSNEYKCYIYKGMPFRLMFPKDYDTTGATKYPLIIMWHGRGESSNIYNNERSMRHGGQKHRDARNNGTYDGFVMYPQNQSGFFSPFHYDYMHELLVNELAPIHVDLNRVGVHGLSAGGSATWNSILAYPGDYACAAPMSASSTTFISQLNQIREITMWQSQGGLDKSPAPATSQQVVDAALALGMHFTYTLYPNLGHGVWNTHYNEADFFPFFQRHNKTNPLVYYRKTEFCPGDTIKAIMALTAGYDGYQWRRNGVIMNGETSHKLIATQLGTYDARIIRGTDTSYWSPTPVVLEMKTATITPPLELAENSSNVIPSPDNSPGVTLKVVGEFEDYAWKLFGNSTVLGTDQTFTATSPGQYVVSVTEEFGCSSSDSPPYLVINGNGANAPATPINPLATPLTKTSMRLTWGEVANQPNPETGFELYRSTTSGSNYEFIKLIDPNVFVYTDNDLISSTDYYYLLRAINNNGASAVTAEFSGKTLADTIPPTTPLNLVVTQTSGNSISLKWNSSTDDAGVDKYEVYRGNYRVLVTSDTFGTIYGLNQNSVYNFVVRARDFALNRSAASNQVTAAATFSGLYYEYYQDAFSVLPDFDALTPEYTGTSPNVDISVRQVDDNFAFRWTGYIDIPVAGNYTFETLSDDGSKLYIGGYGSQYEVVDNDGLHGNRYREGTYNFPAPGPYPIVITFFERTGGHNMQVFWKNTAHGVGSRQQIPDQYFGSSFTMPCCPPSAPYNLTAAALAHDKINLTWTDTASNETGFQIYRSKLAGSGYEPIGIVGPNVTSYLDQTGLEPSTIYNYQVVALGQYGASHDAEGSLEELGPVNAGIGATDNRTGSGYIMFSKQSVHDRFTSPVPHGSNSDHVIAIVNDNGQWKYDNNSTLTSFSALSSDLIIAAVDFSSDQIFSYEGIDTTINGMKAGYASGNLTFFANRWNGSNNSGEFTVLGTTFNRNVVNMASTTTLPLIGAPVAPDNLTATALSNKSIRLQWNDNSNNENKFVIQRSQTSGNGFFSLDTIPGGNYSSVTYVDSILLDPHTDYFYKVYAVNNIATVPTNEATTSTLNSLPELTAIDPVINIKYGSYLNLPLTWSDADNDVLTINIQNLPQFGSFLNNNGAGSLIFGPTIADTNIYTISISVSDLFGGVTADTFLLVVSDNNLPTLDSIPNIIVDEGDVFDYPLTANDSDGIHTLSWDAAGLPDFASYVIDSLGNAVLRVAPGYADGGVYQNVVVRVEDNKLASDSRSLQITVNEKNPNKKLYANFKFVNTAPFPWVNITSVGTVGLNYEDGTSSGISSRIIAPSYTKYNGGANTGNNSGVVPDNVLKDYYWFGGSGAPVTVNLNLTGLNPNNYYNVSFIGSSLWNGTSNNGFTVYSANGISDSVNTQNNSTKMANLIGLTPDASGKMVVNMRKGLNATFGYVNGMIIEELYNYNVIPDAPKNLTASFVNESVSLSWYDAPYNELGYNVFRSESLNGTYTQVNVSPVPTDSTTFVDMTVANNKDYFYKVQAFNAAGVSTYSNTANVQTAQIQLTVYGVDSIFMAEGGTAVTYLNVEGVSGGASINWVGVNMPSFITLNALSGDSVEVNFNPLYADGGPYDDFAIKAITSGGDSIVHPIYMYIDEINPNKKLYANFKFVNTAPTPWKNISSVGTVPLDYEDGNPSNISLRLMAPSFTKYNQGTSTGNNSGIAPDAVLLDYFWFGGSGAPVTVDMNLTGMDPSRKYSLSLIASSAWAGSTNNGFTVFSTSGLTDSVNVHRNTTKTVDFEGISPDVTGKIVVNMKKGANAPFGYVNGVVISEIYNYQGTPDAPRALKAFFENGRVSLNWYDAPYNETGYNIFRSEQENGTYYQMNFLPLPANSTDFIDYTANLNGTYFYKIKAVNDYGESPFSNMASPTELNYTPTLTLSGDTVVKIDHSIVIGIASTDANGDAITLSGSNLPSFATLLDNGNGTGSITLNPLSTDIGMYNFSVTATDSKDSAITKNYQVEVIDNILYTVKINFNQYPNAAGDSPWNNMNRAAVQGDSLINIIDENSNNTGLKMYLQTGFGGVFNQGAQTGNNSGIVPDKVLKEYYWFGAFGAPSQVTLKISNLDNTKKYRFKFIGSSVFRGAGITDNGETVYTIGNQSVNLDVESNTSMAAELSDVIADFNGDVIINITKANGTLVGYINAMIIEALPGDPTAFDPKELKAVAVSESAVDLSWEDNSFDETGFIVERCTTGNEVDFVTYATLPANTTAFSDTGLLTETVYFYRVRGTKAVGFTAYTNIAWSGTISSRVYININGDTKYNAPQPWNNLGISPFDDDVFTGFKNDKGIPVGLEMIWVKAMQGSNDWGNSTGNNSGIVPDTVMRSFFFNDAFDPAGKVRLTNLSQEYVYNFRFFGSIKTGFSINTEFTIGSETVVNSQSYNTSEMVDIKGISSDINNEVTFTVKEATGSNWAIFNAMVIEAIPAPEPAGLKRKPVSNMPTEGAIVVQYGEADPEISIYPNPIQDNQFNISFNNAALGDVTVMVTDLTGRIVNETTFNDNRISNGIIQLNLNDTPLNNGMYIVRVQFADSKVRTSRLVKY